MAQGSVDYSTPGAHGIRGPQGWSVGSDFIDGAWVSLFTITENGDAAAPDSTNTNDEESNGILKITSGSGASDSVAFQMGGETVKMEANKQYWCTCRWNAVDANDSMFMVGFGAYDVADGLETPGQVVDGVYFQSLDASTDIDFVTEKDGTQVDNSAIDSHTLLDSTFVKTDFLIDIGDTAGQGRVRAYLNDKKVTDYYSLVLPTELVGPFMYFATGNAGVETAEVDWVFWGGDRSANSA